MKTLIQFRNGKEVELELSKSYEKPSYKKNHETGMIEFRCDDPLFIANSEDIMFVKQLPDAPN